MKFITGWSDEETQPWARQSLVQLAPVLGRITDPQTVQTTTSDQSEQSVQQSSTGMQQPAHANHRNLKCDNFNVKCTTNMPPCLLPHCCCYYFWPCETSYYIKKKTSILLHYQAKTTKKTNTCASTYHRFCWNCRPQCLQHVCTWSDPRHTFYCRESSWVCKQTTIWTFKITPLSVKKHTKNISVKLSIVLFILSVYVLH